MDDWLYPDNKQRIQRVHTILAQTDNYTQLMFESSRKIQDQFQLSSQLIQEYKSSVERLSSTTPAQLIQSINKIKEKIDELQQKIEDYQSINKEIAIFVTESIAGAIKTVLVNKTNQFAQKSIRNAYVSRYAQKLPEKYATKIAAGEFNIKFPKWLKAEGFSFVSTTMFQIGFDLAFGGIIGKFTREQAREQILLSLDARFYSMKAYLINQAIFKKILFLNGVFEGAKSQIRVIQILMGKGEKQQAEKMLRDNNIIETLEKFYSSKDSQINNQKVWNELKKLDAHAGFIETTVQPNWKPPSQQ